MYRKKYDTDVTTYDTNVISLFILILIKTVFSYISVPMPHENDCKMMIFPSFCNVEF